MMTDADIIVVGGGIVGLSTAMQLTQAYPHLSVLVLEKEQQLAQHQTGRNSGVIHAGVYYAPGSLKARFCKQGVEDTIRFCQQHELPYEQCGKLIIATDDVELERLTALYQRCLENGLQPEMLDKHKLLRKEPRVNGVAAIFVQSSGITDYSKISRKMAELVVEAGSSVMTGQTVVSLNESPDGVVVETETQTFRARYAVVCAGVMADRFARMCGIEANFRIIPFRGEYYRLPEDKNDIVSCLTYPVPDPALPFLGVHLTRMIGGYVTVGPNAVLALAKEGYSWGRWNFKDLGEILSYPGFWRLLGKYGSAGMQELRSSLIKSRYLKQCQKYCPELRSDDLTPYPSGVRAQAVLPDGSLMHDFMVERTERTLHVCNAPSPAATSAIPIGAHITEKVSELIEK